MSTSAQNSTRGKVSRKLFWKLFFRFEITPLDFDPFNRVKSIAVFKFHRMKEVDMHRFVRSSLLTFSDRNSFYSYNILTGELD